MTTWNALFEQLVECEKAKLTIERTGLNAVQQAEEKYQAVTQSVGDERAYHEECMREIRMQAEMQEQEIQLRTQKDVTEADRGKKQAEATMASFVHRTKQANLSASMLEAEIKKLYAALDQKDLETEQTCEKVGNDSYQQVKNISKQANGRVTELLQFASEVQQGATESMTIMQAQHAENIQRSSDRAEGRSGFQEMLSLAKRREPSTGMGLSPKQYESAKKDLMDTWQSQWAPTVTPATSLDSAAGGLFSPTLSPTSSAHTRTPRSAAGTLKFAGSLHFS